MKSLLLWMKWVFNPLTAGAVHICFLYFILSHYISAFKPVKDKKWGNLKSDINQQYLKLVKVLSNLTNIHSLCLADAIHNFNWVEIAIE